MQYLCEKQLTAGSVTYYPGNVIPAGVILPNRSSALIRNGYISELNGEMSEASVSEQRMFTQEQVDRMINKAVSGAVVQITVKGESDRENDSITVVSVTPEEIQQVFSIMQLTAEEGVKAVPEVKSENVLILLHASDTRKTVKEAAKKQADNLFSTNGNMNDASTRNETTDTRKKGADT